MYNLLNMQEDYRIRSGRLSHKLATLNCLVKLRSVMAPASVADPGFFIPGPDFYPSRIPDPTTQQQKRRGEKLL
jgi:hypothetical protein